MLVVKLLFTEVHFKCKIKKIKKKMQKQKEKFKCSKCVMSNVLIVYLIITQKI